jgi:hypothetical protein
MSKLIAVLVLVLCLTFCANYAAATVQAGSEKVLPLPEENSNIILAANASYVESGAQYYFDNSTGLQIHVWDIPMFTTGNGTVNIYASAQNCNLTINSFKQTSAPMETQYSYNVSSSVECTVSGDGVAYVNDDSLDSTHLAVYINGVIRQAGDGWNVTSGYIAIQGRADVVVYSSETEYWPPRGAPHDEFFYPVIVWVAVVIAILAVALVAIYFYSKRWQSTDFAENTH